MAKRFKLTWQPRSHGSGCWKKIYLGRVHYFDGGKGKSDTEAYRRALAKWEQMKVAIDIEAESNKPHRAEYEAAINEWTSVLSWGREHKDHPVVAAASAKIDELRQRLLLKAPPPIGRRSDLPIQQIGMHAGTANLPPASGDAVTPAGAHQLASQLKVSKHTGHGEIHAIVSRFVVGRTWEARIELEQTKQATCESGYSLKEMVADYVKERKSLGISAGGLANLERHLEYRCKHVGGDSDARKVSGKTIEVVHQSLLSDLEKSRFTSVSGQGVLASVKSFVRWLWEKEVLTDLPRNLSSKTFRIVAQPKSIQVFEIEAIRKIYSASNERMKLYVLLALNCGMTQTDISDIRPEEVDWDNVTLSRKRGKTSSFERVPTVIYALWPETLASIKKLKSSDPNRLLLAPGGGPLKFEVERNEKVAKNDYIGLSFRRMLKDLKLTGQFKMLKKTSASLLRDHPTFTGLESLFLDHAPRSMSDKHYAQVPTKLMSDALNWLRSEYRL